MKKNLLLIIATLFSVITFAQTLDYTKDGRHYYIASPNGRYFTGTVNEGPGCFFDAETKQHYATESDSVLIYAVNNDGIACGSLDGFAGVWVRGEEWKMLTALETINDKPIEGGEICGMSADATKFVALMRYDGGKVIPVYCELDKFENWDNADAWDFSTLPTPTKEDLLYNMEPQFIQVCGMNYDATRILGRYRLADGKREVPFIWQKDADNQWTIKFVAQRCLFVEEVVNGEIQIPNREDYTDVVEFDAYRESLEAGYILDLSPYSLFTWTGNGRYIPICVNALSEGAGVDYAAVIDIDNDTLIIFTAVQGAGTVSINDKGEIMIYTPKMNTFRTSYVATIDKPTEATPLFDYVTQRTEGKIDLAKYMNYQRDVDFDDKPIYQTASGSAVWANEGNAFVTFNYDEWNETLVPQCFMVRFDATTPVENVASEQLAIYPNPTSGVVYFDNELTDVAVYDVAGRQVYAQSFAEQTLNLSSLKAGTYLLVAQSNGENITTKIIITK
ncbi:MAG: T9SS type A sorting domain-containing protein [Paludibacteraceae bacterium]|nr:T9SS type A sorting domain-containing protein [Paludibacteraceae bacterium]